MDFKKKTELFSKKKVMIPATIYMNLQNIMLSKRSPSQKTSYYMVPFI